MPDGKPVPIIHFAREWVRLAPNETERTAAILRALLERDIETTGDTPAEADEQLGAIFRGLTPHFAAPLLVMMHALDVDGPDRGLIEQYVVESSHEWTTLQLRWLASRLRGLATTLDTLADEDT